MKRIFLALAILLLTAPAHAASLRTGDLVKASGPAVYYYTGEKRLVFPNDRTYFTWYANFSAVQTISDGELAAVPLGGNVTYRPGSALVKIQSDPRVYAIGANGALRWIASESAATSLYGAGWAKKVQDIPDAFFVNYGTGEDIAVASDFDVAATLAANSTILPGVRTTIPAPSATSTAGTQEKSCAVPAVALAESVASPTTVVGNGAASSCTAAAFESAVQKGGVVTFDCGPSPVTIILDHEIRLLNKVGPAKNGNRVIDGGGLVTLSGGGKNRILYQDACDESLGWLNAHCNDSLEPRLVVQNLTFTAGKASNATIGGGAIYSNGGSLKVVNSVFTDSHVAATGPDVGGGAIYATLLKGPTYVVNSTFGGASGKGNSGSNGGAIGSIFTSFDVYNSVFSYNSATGRGMNPAKAGTPGGGNGGAIATDGNSYNLNLCGSAIANNTSNELGGAIFYVANDVAGHIVIDRTSSHDNATGADYAPAPGIHKPDNYLQTTVGNITLTGSTFVE